MNLSDIRERFLSHLTLGDEFLEYSLSKLMRHFLLKMCLLSNVCWYSIFQVYLALTWQCMLSTIFFFKIITKYQFVNKIFSVNVSIYYCFIDCYCLFITMLFFKIGLMRLQLKMWCSHTNLKGFILWPFKKKIVYLNMLVKCKFYCRWMKISIY